jgi:hypothetical protein
LVLDALDLAELTDAPSSGNRQKRETADRLLRLARRNLRAAVGSADHASYDGFLDALAAHELGVFD